MGRTRKVCCITYRPGRATNDADKNFLEIDASLVEMMCRNHRGRQVSSEPTGRFKTISSPLCDIHYPFLFPIGFDSIALRLKGDLTNEV